MFRRADYPCRSTIVRDYPYRSIEIGDEVGAPRVISYWKVIGGWALTGVRFYGQMLGGVLPPKVGWGWSDLYCDRGVSQSYCIGGPVTNEMRATLY